MKHLFEQYRSWTGTENDWLAAVTWTVIPFADNCLGTIISPKLVKHGEAQWAHNS